MPRNISSHNVSRKNLLSGTLDCSILYKNNLKAMANDTIASGGTYILSQPLSNGSTITFLNNAGTSGALILQNGALAITQGSSTASGSFGGTVANFLPPAYGIGGDQVTVQLIATLFAEFDVAATASSDNADFAGHVTLAAQSGDALLILPDGVVQPTVDTPFTLNANEELVIREIAQAVFGTAAAAAGAILELSFAERENPNSNHPFIDGVLTTTRVAINPCFCAGTRILTTQGDIAVEELRAGDTVITYHGEEQKIIWTGRRVVDIATHLRPELVRPVIIEAEALADGVPVRRLKLSPDHALFLRGVLVPAKALVNWSSIRPDMAAVQASYHHIELGRHDLVFAEGAAAESFLDTGHRGVFDNAAPLAHPVLMQRRREAESCAPLCLGGPQLETIRAEIAARQPGLRRLAGFSVAQPTGASAPPLKAR
jgi:hypothetical protein